MHTPNYLKLPSGNANKLLTSQQAAEILGISERKLWSLRSEGSINHVQIGRAVRFAQEDIHAFIEAMRKASSPQRAG
jgi:excisionase family DNA binding protein